MKLPRLASSSGPSVFQAGGRPGRAAAAAGSVVPMTLADCMAGQLGLGDGVKANLNSFCNPANLGGEAEADCYLRLIGPLSGAGVSGTEVLRQYDFCKNSRMARRLYGDGQFAPPNW
jgi:hypothetical protein